MLLITLLVCATVGKLEGQSLKSYVPVFHPASLSPLCADEPPSLVVSLVEISIGIPPDVHSSVVCGLGCTGYDWCTSFNYRHATIATCEYFTYPLKNCSFSLDSICQHYQISGSYPPSCQTFVTAGWSEWQTLTNCTAVGQLTSTIVRYCNSPTPVNEASACINSAGDSSLIEYGQRPCEECDPNCNSTCSTTGYLTCDGLCNAGYGIKNSSHQCIEMYTDVGCYKDDYVRDLDGAYFWFDDLTRFKCAQACYNQSYRYAGVQDYGQCFCGNSYGRYGPSKDCNWACLGNSSQICGGSWANNVLYLP